MYNYKNMPLPKSTRFAVKTTSTGKKVRLAFTPKGKVIEAKNLKTRATHTQKEFKADAKKKHEKVEGKKTKMAEKKRGTRS